MPIPFSVLMWTHWFYFSEDLKRAFELPEDRTGASWCQIKLDGFVKRPTAALRFIFRHCGVLFVRLIPQDSQALHLELFTLPSHF